jgi:hypothetical protein
MDTPIQCSSFTLEHAGHLKKLTQYSRVLLEKPVRNSLPFMEPKGSLPCSQASAIGPYADPE